MMTRRSSALAPSLLLLLACTTSPDSGVPAVAPAASGAAVVRPGIETFLPDVPPALRGRRVGLITNQSAIDRAGTSVIDLIAQHDELKLVALFAPEHGVREMAEAGEAIDDSIDSRTGVPIHSLYASEDRAPTAAMLKDVDVVVYDLQEVGGRTWTYVSTMALAMRAAAQRGIPFSRGRLSAKDAGPTAPSSRSELRGSTRTRWRAR